MARINEYLDINPSAADDFGTTSAMPMRFSSRIGKPRFFNTKRIGA